MDDKLLEFDTKRIEAVGLEIHKTRAAWSVAADVSIPTLNTFLNGHQVKPRTAERIIRSTNLALADVVKLAGRVTAMRSHNGDGKKKRTA